MHLSLFKTNLGNFYSMSNDEAFFNCLSNGNAWDYELIKTVLNYIPENGNILDIGGHIGTHAIPYSLHRPKSHIYTFEPQLYIRSILEKNKNINNIINLTIIPFGLGHIARNVKLAYDYTSDGYSPNLTVNYTSSYSQNFGGLGITNDPRGEEIQINTVDSLDIKDISYIKVDVEGAETLVIYGAQETIIKYKPLLLIEQSDKDVSKLYFNDCKGLSTFSVTNFLLSIGYTRIDMGNSNYLYIIKNK